MKGSSMPRKAPQTLAQLLDSSATRTPDALALVCGSQRFSYRELADEIALVAGWLVEAGVSPEERIGVLCERGVEQVLALGAVAHAGGAFVLLSPQLKPHQLAHLIDDAEVARVLLSPKQRGLLAELQVGRERPLSALVLDAPTAWVSAPTTTPTNSFGVGPAPALWSEQRVGASPHAPRRATLGDDLGALIYTSGSTGLPKGVALPQRNLVEGAEIVSGYLGVQGADRLLGVLPLNFDYGLNQLTSAWLHGAALVLHDFFMPRDLIALLAREQITVFAGLRPIWLAMFRGRFALRPRRPEGQEAGDIPELPALRILTNTGGRMPQTILEDLRRAFPATEIFLMYGLTEAFRSTFLPPAELERRPTSIGKAIPGVEIMVVDEQGDEVPPGVEGELVHRGALVSRGYWKRPEATAQVFRPNPRYADQPQLGERVVYSGDRVTRDADGFLYFVGRGDALIKNAGHRISPQEIEEAVLEACPAASQAVAFGVEHDDERDTVIVCVLEGDPATIDGRSLRRELRKRLPGHMQPAEIFVETALPRTASGKIDRASVATAHRPST
jgi:acyl-CoA ligase (AMP-forming) (exosortase A-associated)